MKRNFFLGKSKRVLGIIMAASIALTGIPFPASQVQASESEITVSGLTGNTLAVSDATNETISIGNDQLTRTFKIVNGKLMTGTIHNTLAGENVEFTPAAGSEEFVIRTLGSKGVRQEPETALTSVRPDIETDEEEAPEASAAPEISVSSSMANDGGGMPAATDKNAGTYWSSAIQEEDTAYFEVIFTGEKKVTEVQYTPRWDNNAKYDCTGRIYTMKFEVYDGNEWTYLTDESDNVKIFDMGKSNTKEDYPVTLSGLNVVSKGIRVRANEVYYHAGGNKVINIAEIDIFGTDSNAADGTQPASLIHVETPVEPEEPEESEVQDWILTGNSNFTNADGSGDGGGYAALLDGDPTTRYHSNYNGNPWPVKFTLDRGENAADAPFQTVGYLPRPGGDTNNGSFKTFEVYAADSGEDAELFKEENRLTFADGTTIGHIRYIDALTNELAANDGNKRISKWIYTALENSCNKRYIGIKVLTAVTDQAVNFASGSGLDLFAEKFDSVPASSIYSGEEIKASELTLVNVTSEVHKTNGGKEGNEGEKSGQLLTFEFAPIKWGGQGTATIYQKVVMYEGDHYMRKWVEIKFSEDADKLNRIAYIDGEHLYTTPSTADLNADKPANEDAGKDVIWTIPPNSGNIVLMDEVKGDLGQPVYINGLFMGSEFPSAQNKIEKADATGTAEAGTRLAISRYYTGKNLGDLERDDNFLNQLTDDNKFVSWQTVMGASRSDGTDQSIVQQDFFSYIREIATPSDFRIQYNSWYDNMMRITDENIMEAFKDIDKNFVKTGVRPLDSYVIDDGWNVYRKTSNDLQGGIDIERNGKDDVNTTGFWEINSKFPNEFYTSSNYVQNMGSYFGVWIGPRGGYNYNGMLADIIQTGVDADGDGVKEQYGSAAGGSIDVADGRYVQKFAEMVVDWTNRFKVNYWKWDGFADQSQYNSFSKGSLDTVGYSESNQHMYGGPNGEYHVTDLWEKWIYIMESVRTAAANNGIDNLWISLTCYTNPSPWHLQWANSVWIQCGLDRGDFSNGVMTDKMNTMLTYRDSVYHNFIVDHEFQFPLSNVYNHDPIYGKEDTGIDANSMNGEQFRNYLFMQSGRGTAFWELYYSDSILNDEKYLINADYLEWAEENYDLLKHAIMVGDSPNDAITLTNNDGSQDLSKQSVYGFANFSETEADGLLYMRNPVAEDRTFTVKLDESIGVRFDADYTMWKEHVYLHGEGQTEAAYQVNGAAPTDNILHKGDTISITLKPGETQIWHLKEGGDTTAPVLDKIYFNDANTIQVRASERLDNTNITFAVNGKDVPAENVTKYADLRSFIITLDEEMTDGEMITVTTANGTDNAGNELTGNIAAKYYEENIIVSVRSIYESGILSSADRSVSGDQGFAVSAEVVYGEKNVELLKQGENYVLGINANGQPYFTVNGVTATSDMVMTEGKSYRLSGIRENNGYVRLYINSQIDKAAYDKSCVEFEVEAAPITYETGKNTVKNVLVHSTALAYDEVPISGLGELVNEITASKDRYTSASWTSAGMDAALTAAKEALASEQEEQQANAYDNLMATYKQLIPVIKENCAAGKMPTRGWADGSSYDNSYNSIRLNNATNGTKSLSDYTIFGHEGAANAKPAYMQIDLGEEISLDSVKLWRYWDSGRMYSATALVVSNDADFKEKDVLYYSHPDVTEEGTPAGADIFGLGEIPSNKLYNEEETGKILYQSDDEKEIRKVRYVRIYGNGVKGSESTSENHVVELEVYGKVTDPYDLQGLQELVDKAEAEIVTGVYAADSVAVLQELVDEAKGFISAGVPAGATIADVEDFKNRLETAINELEPKVKLYGYSLTLEGTIGVNFYMNLADEVLNDANAYMSFVVGDAEEDMQVYVKDVKDSKVVMEDGTECYVFKCGVPVKDMDTVIKAQIISSDYQESLIYTYTVEKYIENIKTDDKYTGQEKLIALVETMSDFGDYATAYFDEDKLAVTPEMEAVTAETLKDYQGGLPEDKSYYGSSLLLKSDTVIRHYFTKELTQAPAGYTIGNKGSLYYIESKGIPAHELGNAVVIEVDGMEITYSPLSYAYTALSRDGVSENLRDVMRAMYLYHEAAQEYITEIQK